MFYLLLHFIYSFVVTLSILIPDQCSSTLPASLQPLRACLLHTISSAWQRNALCVLFSGTSSQNEQKHHKQGYSPCRTVDVYV